MRDLSMELDDAARALYITLTSEPIVETLEVMPDRVFVDVDANNEIVGVEILEVTSDGLPELLHEVEKVLKKVRKSTGHELAIA